MSKPANRFHKCRYGLSETPRLHKAIQKRQDCSFIFKKEMGAPPREMPFSEMRVRGDSNSRPTDWNYYSI